MNLLAWFLSRPLVCKWIIQYAMRTPFFHLDGYLRRWWMFNPYQDENQIPCPKHRRWLPSIRVHHILREDLGHHLHDHPWNARTFILHGWYIETKNEAADPLILRSAGDTATLKFGEFHRITQVSEGGVWTLFVTGRKRGTWGFKVGDRKIPWKEYLS